MASSAPAGSADPAGGRVPVAIALGSNLGDRRAHLLWAVEQLSADLDDLVLSPIFETDPVEVPDVQPPFLNAVAIGRTGLAARALLDRLLEVEQLGGRTRAARHAARTLDLDLILYGAHIIDAPGLVVPHPRFRERQFVLEPLSAVASGWIDPVTGKSVEALWKDLSRAEPT